MKNLNGWVRYWNAAKMVNFAEIKTMEDAAQAIKYCSCLRSGAAVELTPSALLMAVKTEFPRT